MDLKRAVLLALTRIKQLDARLRGAETVARASAVRMEEIQGRIAEDIETVARASADLMEEAQGRIAEDIETVARASADLMEEARGRIAEDIETVARASDASAAAQLQQHRRLERTVENLKAALAEKAEADATARLADAVAAIRREARAIDGAVRREASARVAAEKAARRDAEKAARTLRTAVDRTAKAAKGNAAAIGGLAAALESAAEKTKADIKAATGDVVREDDFNKEIARLEKAVDAARDLARKAGGGGGGGIDERQVQEIIRKMNPFAGYRLSDERSIAGYVYYGYVRENGPGWYFERVETLGDDVEYRYAVDSGTYADALADPSALTYKNLQEVDIP